MVLKQTREMQLKDVAVLEKQYRLPVLLAKLDLNQLSVGPSAHHERDPSDLQLQAILLVIALAAMLIGQLLLRL